MFEHLGPIPEVNIDKKRTNYKFYLSLLVLSVFAFMFAMGISEGPSSQAHEPRGLSSSIAVDTSNKKIVATTKNFSVFDFVIDVNRTDASLYKLNILVDGIYDLDLISDLKLFHEGVQLGAINTIDDTGKLHFDLAEYKLKAGQNKFSLFFNNGDSLEVGQILQFSIPTKDDIFLISNRHIFRPSVDFPLSGGLISIVDQGEVMVSNSNLINDFLISSDVPQQVSAFELSSIGEQVDLKQIKLSYQSLSVDDYPDLDFVLIHKNQIISEAVSHDGEIVFDLFKTIVLQDLERDKFYLYSIGMPEGIYQFFVNNVEAQGALSGLDILLLDKISLSKVEAKPYFILLKSGYLNKKLSAGWNQIYNLNIKTVGQGPTYLNKITWQIDKQNLDIESVEIWKDGQLYIADIVLKDDKLIVKTDGLDPLEIGSDYTKILVLANLVNVGEKAKLEAFILPDKQPIDEELLSGNIIWSKDDNFYNGYKIPFLPLEPSILSN